MPEQQPYHKACVIGFIKLQGDTDYVFDLRVEQTSDADKFIQRMRVELSRMRNFVRRKNLVVKPFRMKLISIDFTPARPNSLDGVCKITLRKDKPDAQIARDVGEAFSYLTDGNPVNDF